MRAAAAGGPGGPSGSEDCLHLNVTAPSASPSGGQRRPVMVWFHGGGFVNGAGDLYRPERLLDGVRPHGHCACVAAVRLRRIRAVLRTGGGRDPHGGRARGTPLRVLGRAVALSSSHQGMLVTTYPSGVRTDTVPLSP
ncbi:carboxylesterase family protein [Streptomyces sp. NPDC050448]|uniref:carboxylesterase family protein n=1 Tax=Streptomyces sp. NPDC050448 TaxID=3155404 RepID=UPI0034189943